MGEMERSELGRITGDSEREGRFEGTLRVLVEAVAWWVLVVLSVGSSLSGEGLCLGLVGLLSLDGRLVGGKFKVPASGDGVRLGTTLCGSGADRSRTLVEGVGPNID
jgi:hypothetical protein